MECIGIAKRCAIELQGLLALVSCFRRTPEPVTCFCAAQRSVGCFAKCQEMLLGLIDVLEISKRNPARHERLLLERVHGQGARLAHDLVGELWLFEFEGFIGDCLALFPPAVRRNDERFRRRRAEQEFRCFVDFPARLRLCT